MPYSSYQIMLSQAMAADGLKAELDILKKAKVDEPRISGVTLFMTGALLGLVEGFVMVKH